MFDIIWNGLKDAFLMAWEVWWALVLGFAISAIVQAWVPRERIESVMSGSGARSIGWSTGLGAATGIVAALFWLTARRGATDPVCGMKVDRSKALAETIGDETFYFCGADCRQAFAADPGRYQRAPVTRISRRGRAPATPQSGDGPARRPSRRRGRRSRAGG